MLTSTDPTDRNASFRRRQFLIVIFQEEEICIIQATQHLLQAIAHLVKIIQQKRHTLRF